MDAWWQALNLPLQIFYGIGIVAAVALVFEGILTLSGFGHHSVTDLSGDHPDQFGVISVRTIEQAATAPAAPATAKPAANPEATRAKVRHWLVAHKNLLTAFDADENNNIDDREIDNALNMTLQWAGIVRQQPSAKWFLASQGTSLGPKSWAEVESAARAQSDLLVSLEGTDFWLPVEVVQLAR